MSAEEVRTTSITGGEKGMKLAQFSLLPMEALKEVAEHYGVGAKKYEKHNMRKGYEWSKSFDAAMRHLTQFWAGEDRDEETGSKHLAAVVFHALTLMEFMETHREYDDRYKPEGKITNLDVGSFGKKSDAETSEGIGEQAQKIWAEVQEAAKRTGWTRSANDLESGSLIVHETIRPTPGEMPIAHFDVLRDGRIVQNFDIDSAHEESVREKIRDTTQESHDAWDAGRPFGRFPSPIDAMLINRDKDKK